MPFVESYPARWSELPIPNGHIAVGLADGGVRDWTDRKAHFELIVGRSIPVSTAGSRDEGRAAGACSP